MFSRTLSAHSCTTACPPHWLPASFLEPEVRTTSPRLSTGHLSPSTPHQPGTSFSQHLLRPVVPPLWSKYKLRQIHPPEGAMEGRCPGPQKPTFPNALILRPHTAGPGLAQPGPSWSPSLKITLQDSTDTQRKKGERHMQTSGKSLPASLLLRVPSKGYSTAYLRTQSEHLYYQRSR